MGTAQLFITPSISRRKSKCRWLAACFCTTKRNVARASRRRPLRRPRGLGGLGEVALAPVLGERRARALLRGHRRRPLGALLPRGRLRGLRCLGRRRFLDGRLVGRRLVGRCLLRRGLPARRLAEARLEPRHQVEHLAVAHLVLGHARRDLLSLELGLDDLHQVGPVVVGVLGRIEGRREVVHELLGHLELLRPHERGVGEGVLVGVHQLRGEAHDLEHQRVAHDPDAGQVLRLAHGHLADADDARVAHGLAQQRVRLLAPLGGQQVVGRLEEARIDLALLHEIADVDRLRRLERRGLEVLVGDHDVLPLLVLVALDDLLPRHRIPVARHALVLHGGQVRLVQHLEADAIRADGGLQLDGDVHEAEGQRAFPDRGHVVAWWGWKGRLLIVKGSKTGAGDLRGSLRRRRFTRIAPCTRKLLDIARVQELCCHAVLRVLRVLRGLRGSA